MTVSIIIAVKTWQKNLEKCVGKCLGIDFSDFEILILPDNPIERELKDERIRIIPTGAISPAEKRDKAVSFAKGDILAFIDDDAYPQKDWLKNAVKNFIDPDVAAVGGPAVTPHEDSLRQKASGLVYASALVSGRYVYRYLPKKKLEVDDYPSCNFLVRKTIMQELGGFKTNFWPGEDTKLCLDITKRLNKKIIYDPEVLVWHHRRPLFIPHLKQVENYALHRGYFVKKYPETSCKLYYFIPTLFLLALLTGGFLSIFLAAFRIIYLLGFSLYLVLVLIFSVSKKLGFIPLIFFGIIFTHFAYGTYFFKGLLSQRLKEEL